MGVRRKSTFTHTPEFGCAIVSIRTAVSVLKRAIVQSIGILEKRGGDRYPLFVTFCRNALLQEKVQNLRTLSVNIRKTWLTIFVD